MVVWGNTDWISIPLFPRGGLFFLCNVHPHVRADVRVDLGKNITNSLGLDEQWLLFIALGGPFSMTTTSWPSMGAFLSSVESVYYLTSPEWPAQLPVCAGHCEMAPLTGAPLQFFPRNVLLYVTVEKCSGNQSTASPKPNPMA